MSEIAKLFQQMSESSHPVLKAIGNFFLAAMTAIYTFLGVLNDSFFRIVEPETWTLQDIASFVAIPASIMYFLKLRTERQIAKIQLKRMIKEGEVDE
jgi:hypothetical protein